MSTQNPAETVAPAEAPKPLVAVAAESPLPLKQAAKAPAKKAAKKAPTKAAAKTSAGGQVAAPAVARPQKKLPNKPPAKKALAKAVPIAPWPPAGVAGGTITAPAVPAAPVARKAGASVGSQVRAKKLSVKPVAQDAKAAAKPAGKVAGKSLKAGAKPGKTSVPGVEDKPAKLRVKLVRDSFTMPQVDFDLIDALKKRALAFQHPAKKSELLRAGLQALAALDDARLGALLKGLPLLKPGRPKKAG